MPQYKLYSWGANSHGQLGQGTRSDECWFPTEVDLSGTLLEAGSIKKIVGNGGHTLALDKAGQIFACGWNNKGQVGVSGELELPKFTKLRKMENIVDLSCGWNSSAAVSGDNVLFLWGSNQYGQLGEEFSDYNFYGKPKKSSMLARGVSMGLRHCLIISGNDNCVFAAGANNKGQLGVDGETTNGFRKVPGISNVEKVACGEKSSLAVASGKLYGWGDNKFFQLGPQDDITFSRTSPSLTQINVENKSVLYAGWHHAVLHQDGGLLTWGRNTYKQVNDQNIDVFRQPQRVNFPEKVKQVAVGSAHNVVLTELGDVYCWGWNEHGSCGKNPNERIVKLSDALQKPILKNAVLIGAGSGHSFAVTECQ